MNDAAVNWRKRAFLLLAGVFLFRLVFNVFFYGFDLAGDEAYYWDWGRHLDWGYYSKPPLIGWLMGALRLIGADSPAGIRITSTLIGTGTLAFIYFIAERLFSARTAFWALLLSICTIGNTALNIALATDVPLSLCWCGALFSFWNWLEKPDAKRAGVLFLFLGIGALAKQMMWVFIPLALLFLIITPEKRGLLKKPAIWLSPLSPALFNLPAIIWNARNNWITFQHTGEHFSSHPFCILESLSQFAEFIGTQFGLLTPVTCALLIVVLFTQFKHWKKLPLANRYLLFFTAPLIGFALFSFHRTINPNWPLVFYLPALILLAGVCCERGRAFFFWMRTAGLTGGVFCVAFYLMLAVLPHTGADVTPIAPLRQISGWSDYGRQVAAVHRSFPNPGKTLLITFTHRYHTAALAFYHPDRPEVYNWNASPAVNHQYDLWPWPKAEGQDVLLVAQGKGDLPEKLAARLGPMEFITFIEIPPGGRKAKQYSLYRTTLIANE